MMLSIFPNVKDWNDCMIVINEIIAKEVDVAYNNELHCNVPGVTGDIHVTPHSL